MGNEEEINTRSFGSISDECVCHRCVTIFSGEDVLSCCVLMIVRQSCEKCVDIFESKGLKFVFF